eukprot:Gregarina_sp_Poly_1__10487@NODE_767_length_6374_cov_59_374822_g564_i0_p4_GENE_NODE_767_length_6374_cov_59_374822_g564_i0NODE_767_length_6374_cov_59_374822_g564_i0_p4_ORF_typecomplete_len126_score13_46PurL_C/PF16904_5/0_064PurL_C/PF16904_5/5e03_NODE_767_length_6374_cov_59_374822_g564_i056816058
MRQQKPTPLEQEVQRKNCQDKWVGLRAFKEKRESHVKEEITEINRGNFAMIALRISRYNCIQDKTKSNDLNVNNMQSPKSNPPSWDPRNLTPNFVAKKSAHVVFVSALLAVKHHRETRKSLSHFA